MHNTITQNVGYEIHKNYIKAICYRMLGDADEAEDLTQDVFFRALSRPPKDPQLPIKPWLSRVAVNLSIDALRRRQRRAYTGHWIPSPIENDAAAWLSPPLAPPSDTKYDLMESANLAFLFALEALTAEQRAVLVLRDVLGLSGAETAELLGLTDVHVRVLHHRAKSKLQAYDASRPPTPTPEARVQVATMLGFILQAIASGDAAQVARLMTSNVAMVQDGGGEVKASLRTVYGAAAVARFFISLSTKPDIPPIQDVRIVSANHWPALLVQFQEGHARHATHSFLQFQITPNGLVHQILGVVAPNKLRWIT